MEFKIDTGADVTVISEKTFHTLTPERRLKPPDIPLDSPGGELLCLGCFDATIKHQGRDYVFTAYVVRGHIVNNLLLISEDEPGKAGRRGTIQRLSSTSLR